MCYHLVSSGFCAVRCGLGIFGARLFCLTLKILLWLKNNLFLHLPAIPPILLGCLDFLSFVRVASVNGVLSRLAKVPANLLSSVTLLLLSVSTMASPAMICLSNCGPRCADAA